MSTPTSGTSNSTMSLPCWNCGETCANPHVCVECSSIVPTPVQVDYFTILGLENRYVIDPVALRRSYLNLSRRLHPDRFGKKTLREKRIAVEKSATINAAYKTLLDPIRRAEYLLAKEANLKDLEKLRASPNLLEEVMETRETISALQEKKDQNSRKTLQKLLEKAETEKDRILSSLEEYFQRFDQNDCTVLSQIEQEVVAHRYNRGILQEISSILSR